ncbi:MAG TPA: MarR family transcriptional regulator [Dehalococcoidia bacterium]|nr:MarR family transcriptional regulator [Dehalococcoidia bacterium]
MQQTRRERLRDLERQNLSQLLRMPYQAFIAELHARLADAGYPDIRPAHGIVFQHLRAEGVRVTELAERAQLTKQYIGTLVADLLARGYLERVPDPADGRAKLVRMTERGWELTRVAEAIIAELEAGWVERVGPQRLKQLRHRLEHLILALDHRLP